MTYDDWYIIEFPILVIESDIEHKGCDTVEERHNADKHVEFRWRWEIPCCWKYIKYDKQWKMDTNIRYQMRKKKRW